MFYRVIDEDISNYLSVPIFSGELFFLTDKNRLYLKKWLPWLDGVQQASDTKAFIEKQLQRFSREEAIHQTIFYRQQIAGVLGYNFIDKVNGIGHLGYWLGQEFMGRGIMTKSVNDTIEMGFLELGLQRIEIRCAVDNNKSRAIPERIGFRNEGLIRNAEKVNGKYFDHVVYGLIR